MAGPGMWATNAMGGGDTNLEDARRRYSVIWAELEAIRRGQKKASKAEITKLEGQLRQVQDAVTSAQAASPTAPTTTGGAGAPLVGALRSAPGVKVPLPQTGGGVSAMGAPRARGAGIMSAPYESGLGDLTPAPITRPSTPALPMIGKGGGTSTPALPPLASPTAPATYVPGRPAGGGGSPTWGSLPAPPTGGGMGGYNPEEIMAANDPYWAMYTPEQKARILELKSGGTLPENTGIGTIGLAPGAMTDYQQAMYGLEQSSQAAQQAYQQQSLEQAWAIAQQNLAQAQKQMAAHIGTSASQQQGQQWAQGLPYVLPKTTRVAPGFEAGGPMSQLYRMSGSQFHPGMTGRIAKSPAPSMDQIMGWVQQAMGKFS